MVISSLSGSDFCADDFEASGSSVDYLYLPNERESELFLVSNSRLVLFSVDIFGLFFCFSSILCIYFHVTLHPFNNKTRLDFETSLHVRPSPPSRPHHSPFRCWLLLHAHAAEIQRFSSAANFLLEFCVTEAKKRRKKIEHNNFSDCETKKLSLGYFSQLSRAAARASLYPMSNGGSIRSKLPVRESSQENLNFLLFAACRYRVDERLKVSRRQTRRGWRDGKEQVSSVDAAIQRSEKKRGERRYRAENMPIYSTHSLPTLCVCIVHNKKMIFCLL